MFEPKNALFESVKCVLNKTLFTYEITDDKAFYILARENGLSGMIFNVLDKKIIKQEVYLRFQKDFLLFNAQHEQQIVLIKKMEQLLNEKQIEHIFLKGTALKAFYPESYMRSMGDIDILVKKDKMKEVFLVFKENKIGLIAKSSAHDNYEDNQGLSIEVHPEISREIQTKYDEISNHTWEESLNISESRYQLNPEYELCYLLVHMIKHFYSSGVGLRSILDIGLFVKENQEIFDERKLIEQLEKYQLKQFFLNILFLNKVYFDINPLNTWLETFTMKEDTFDHITDYILTSGVHGHGISFNRFIGRLGSNRLQEKSRLSLVFSIIFPSFKDMKGMFPWLRYLPFLLPLAWIIRWFKIIFLRFKYSIKKVKSLFTGKREVEEVSNLYKEIGL